jgi:hypothetical protein
LSANTTEYDKTTEVPELPCPACIEAATVLKEGQEFIPGYALQKYTFEQLDDHLNSDKHSREQLIEVAMRASIFLYRQAFEELESVQ